jgi:hypothetical protein
MRVIGIVLGVIMIMSGILLWTPYAIGDHENLAEGPIVVDEHWIDVLQLEDKSTLAIDEFLFINNTGDKPFSGDFYIWLDRGSEIMAKCCGNAPNMACRFQTAGAMACFNFAQIEDNVFKGEPFFSNDIVSYFNQKEQLKITAQSKDNISIFKDISLNVTIGGISARRITDNNSEEGPLSITSDFDELGIEVELDQNMPNNITVSENIQITNNQTDNVTLILTMEGVPLGWNTHLLNENETITEIFLPPLYKVNLTLLLTVPSYIAPIKVSYQTKIVEEGDKEIKGTFEKQYLYDSKRLEYFIFALSDKGLTFSNDLQVVHPSSQGEPELNEEYNRFWYVAQSFNILADSKSTITLEWEDSQDTISLLALIILIIIVALLVGVPLVRRRTRLTTSGMTQDEGSSQSIAEVLDVNEPSELQDMKDDKQNFPQDMTSKTASSGRKRVQNITFVLTKIKNDHENGLLPDETYEELENKYKSELSLAEEELKKEKILISKRQKLALAIERLKKDHENGRLDDDTYNTLLKDYKKMINGLPKEN